MECPASSEEYWANPGRPRKRFETVSGDKACDGASSRAAIRSRGCQPLIPHRKKRDGAYPQSALEFDKDKYRRRNVVERLIGRLKERRRIAMRYGRLAESSRASVLLGFTRIRTRTRLSDIA
jgi:transposase